MHAVIVLVTNWQYEEYCHQQNIYVLGDLQHCNQNFSVQFVQKKTITQEDFCTVRDKEYRFLTEPHLEMLSLATCLLVTSEY